MQSDSRMKKWLDAGYRITCSHARPLRVDVQTIIGWNRERDLPFPRVKDHDEITQQLDFFTRYDLQKMGYEPADYREIISQTGGVTTATLWAPDGTMVAQATACCRLDEQFQRKLGHNIATGKLLAAMEQED